MTSDPYSVPSATTDSQRLEAFSDAVIAIMLTLLSIELLHLGPSDGAGESISHRIIALWPSFLAFSLSFLVVGQIWITHHNLWRLIQRVDQVMLAENLALLFFVALLPFSAKLLPETISAPSRSDRQLAFAAYAATALGQALTFNLLLWWARKQNLLAPQVSSIVVRAISKRFLVGPTIYTVALGCSFVSPRISLACYIGVIAMYIFPGSGDLEVSSSSR